MLKSANINNAVKDTLEIFQFDQWLRFYFTKESDSGLRLEVPAEVMDRIEKDQPLLHRLADTMNNSPLDYKSNQEKVCAYVASRLDGQKYEASVLPRVFDNATFKIEMYIFNVWLKMHESYLDEEYRNFGDWMELYAGWNALDEVKEYRKKLVDSGADPGAPACDTAQ